MADQGFEYEEGLKAGAARERERIEGLAAKAIERSYNELKIAEGDMGVFLMNRTGKWFAAGNTFIEALESATATPEEDQ